MNRHEEDGVEIGDGENSSRSGDSDRSQNHVSQNSSRTSAASSVDVGWHDEDVDSDSIHSDASSQSIASYEELDYYGHTTSIRRRGAVHDDSENHIDDDEAENEFHRRRATRRRRRHWPSSLSEVYEIWVEECRRICRQRSSLLLIGSFLFWLAVRVCYTTDSSSQADMDQLRQESLRLRHQIRHGGMPTAEEIERLRKKRDTESRSALGSAVQEVAQEAKEGFFSLVGGGKRGKKKSSEVPPRGCKYGDWQVLSFPTCNIIHELDLREEVGIHRKGSPATNYIGSGLWRDVWKMAGRGDDDLTVLKMMKGEHVVDSRNLDRHRRDALTMERLTSSPNIVSIFGYCGNTVVTEYADRTLDRIIFDGMDDDLSRQTALGRLRLSLGVARGVAAMHNVQGGPIIHSDLQAKQFLVDSNGTVLLNDFNRCRFMPHEKETGESCPIRIPTAPGRHRAPEEYELNPLTEKLDIYSVANILFAILMGEEPWINYRGTQVKDLVKNGSKPPIDKKYLVPDSSDAALAALIDLSYELDPDDRLNATELVNQLERLVASEEARLLKD